MLRNEGLAIARVQLARCVCRMLRNEGLAIARVQLARCVSYVT